jgi:anti-sigma B factor antagonist
MRVQSKKQGTCVVVEAVSPEVNLTLAEDFKEAVLERYESQGGGDLLIDLRQVNFMDSKAIGAMVAIRKAVAARGGRMGICELHPHVRKVVGVVTLGTIFDIFGTLDEALAAYRCGS